MVYLILYVDVILLIGNDVVVPFHGKSLVVIPI